MGITLALLGVIGGSGGGNPYVMGSDAGYWGGGYQMAAVVDRFQFDTDSRLTLSLTISDYASAVGVSYDGTAAYTGYDHPTSPSAGDYQKLAYASDTVSTLSTTITDLRQTAAAWGDGTYGYIGGGYNGSSLPPRRDQVDKLTYSTETRSNGASNLSGGRNANLGLSSTSNGYSLGGFTGLELNTVDKFALSTGSRSSATALSAITSGGTTTTNRATAGYIMTDAVGSPYTDVWKRTYSTETNSTISAMLSTGISPHPGGTGTGVNDGSTSGFLGGYNTSNVFKITFSTDTAAQLATGMSVATRSGFAAANGWS